MSYSCLLTQSTRPAVFISWMCFRHLRKEKRDTEQQKVVPTARPQLEHSFSVGISSTTHKTRTHLIAIAQPVHLRSKWRSTTHTCARWIFCMKGIV
jgi:hypothetical protein